MIRKRSRSSLVNTDRAAFIIFTARKYKYHRYDNTRYLSVTTNGKRENRKFLYLIRHATTLKPRVTTVPPALPLTSRHFSTFALLIRQSEREEGEKRKGESQTVPVENRGGERKAGEYKEEHLFYNNTLSSHSWSLSLYSGPFHVRETSALTRIRDTGTSARTFRRPVPDRFSTIIHPRSTGSFSCLAPRGYRNHVLG